MKKFEDLTEKEQYFWHSKAVQILGSLYACTRVWEAWHYGTMSEHDFCLACEDDDIVYDTAIGMYQAHNEFITDKR